MTDVRPETADNDQDDMTSRPALPCAPTGLDRQEDGSPELIEALRARIADHDVAATRRHAELQSELARHEVIRSARLHQERLNFARSAFDEVYSAYGELAMASAAAFDDLYAISCRVAVVFKAALRAEHARLEALSGVRTAWLELRELNDDVVTEPGLDAPRNFVFGPHDPRRGTSITALLVYPELKRELAKLSSSGHPRLYETSPRRGQVSSRPREEQASAPPTVSEGQETDQLEVLFRRAQAKRGHDDRQVSAAAR